MGEVAEGKVNGHGTEPQAIIPAATTAVMPTSLAEFEARAALQIAKRQAILRLIAVNLEPNDITLYGEGDKQTIHLNKKACKDILGWGGIIVRPDNPIVATRYDGEDGPYIIFEAWGTWFSENGAEHRSVGNCPTTDDFFSKRTAYFCENCGSRGRWEGSGNTKKFVCEKEQKGVRWVKKDYHLPLSEVDIASIQLKAVTNLWNHVVEDAGLKPSKRELEAVGFKFEQAGANVKFNDNKAPQSASQKPQVASPSKAAAANAPETPTAAATPPQKAEVPKAQIPKDNSAPKKAAQNTSLPVGKGIVSEVREKKTKAKEKEGKLVGGGKPFLEVIQNGHFLYCFANHEIETMEGPEKTFALIQGAKGQFCEFTIETKDGERPMHSIVGATRIGRHQWEADGTPVRPSEPNGYQATDEDIPF